MSRTTTDDCRENCPNHFNLAYHAAMRAQEIMRRGDPRVPEGEDKPVVVALREIARGLYETPALAAETDETAEAALAAGNAGIAEMSEAEEVAETAEDGGE